MFDPSKYIAAQGCRASTCSCGRMCEADEGGFGVGFGCLTRGWGKEAGTKRPGPGM